MPEKSPQLCKRTKRNSVLTAEDQHNPQSNKNYPICKKAGSMILKKEKNQPLEDKSYKIKQKKRCKNIRPSFKFFKKFNGHKLI